MIKCKSGRFTPAFILLILSRGANHGLGILNEMDALVPRHRMDTAIIYRTLKDLEKKELIASYWLDSDAGPRKKNYEITEAGREQLDLLKDDVELVVDNLKIFLSLYDEL